MVWIYTVSKTRVFLPFIIILFCTFCKQHCEYATYTLRYVPQLSTVIDSQMLLDRVSLVYFKDSIIARKYFPDSFYFEVPLIRLGCNFYEIRRKSNDYGTFLGKDFILTLSFNDTTFIYNSAQEIALTASDYSYADCKYCIKKDKDAYVSVKRSTIDTTFSEQFFYDNRFCISMYIVTFKNNKLVYKLE